LKIKGTEQPNNRRVIRLLTERPPPVSAPIFRLSGSRGSLLGLSLPPARIEQFDGSATEDERNEECEDYAEHTDDCACLKWIEQNKRQRYFIAEQIGIILDRVHREQDPEELALLLGKIACFESELDVLQKRWWEVRDADSEYNLPRDMAQNIFDRELCGFHSEKAKFEKRDDHCESAYMFYIQALNEISARLRPPVAVTTEPERGQKPTEAPSATPLKKHQVPSTPSQTKKKPAKAPNRNRTISIEVKY
jgi:hypothetical protein